jgi:LmbE family N-acetylglucosaminyl deacetylase
MERKELIERTMLTLNFKKDGASPLKMLCLGAHSDDIEIGCGGSILRLLQENQNAEVFWIVFSANPKRKKEALSSADLFLAEIKKKEIRVENFRESFFPYIGTAIKEYFEKLKQKFIPDLIFTPWRGDFHQDHRLISELTWNTFRNHLILEYEIVKYDGDLGRPNVYINLDKQICEEKVDIILKSFKTQETKKWFSSDAFMSIMRLRGVETNSTKKYAEAFYGRKITL